MPQAFAPPGRRDVTQRFVTGVAESGALLDRIIERRAHSEGGALTVRAYGRLHAALHRTPWGSVHQQTWALMDGQTLVASAERYALTAVLDSRTLSVCAIGSLCLHTSPGDASAILELVRSLTDTAATSGSEVALLFPASGDRGWEDEGFDLMPSRDVVLRVTESARHGAPMTTIRAGEERDLEAIVAMGRKRAEGVRFHLDRDVDFVRYVIARKRLLAGLGAIHARQLMFFIAEEGITAAAYVVISVVGDEWTLEECGDRDPSGARVGALLQALIAREPGQPRPTIRASLRAGFLPPQVTIASVAPSNDGIRIKILGSPDVSLRLDDVLYWRSDRL
jgi:hypothetical protein